MGNWDSSPEEAAAGLSLAGDPRPAQGFGRDSIAASGNSMSKAPEERETVQRAGRFKDLMVQQGWR